MALLGRYFSERDMKLMASLNGELMGDIIQSQIFIFKICPQQTAINIYGEAGSQGKYFWPGVEITALIDRADIDTTYDDFGPDRNQSVVFKMREDMLKLINIYPENGDVIKFNERYHTINNVIQEQFLGGVAEKSWSIIVNTNYTRLSQLNIVERQI
jgi:hypothetical protein